MESDVSTFYVRSERLGFGRQLVIEKYGTGAAEMWISVPHYDSDKHLYIEADDVQYVAKKLRALADWMEGKTNE